MKSCEACGVEKPLKEYRSYPRKNGERTYRSDCLACESERMVAAREATLMEQVAAGEMIPVAPFQERLAELEHRYMLERRTWTVSDSSESVDFLSPMAAACVRLGWMCTKSGRVPAADTTRLKRTVGLVPHAPSRKKDGRVYPGLRRRFIPYEMAVEVCRALEADPVDMGL